MIVIPGMIAIFCLTLTSAFLVYLGEITMAATPLLFMIFAIVVMKYEPWSMKRQLRKSPFNGQEIVVIITDDSFQIKSTLATSSFTWELFTKVVVFKDGILFFQGPINCFWMPYSGLLDGNREQLQSFIRTHLPVNTIVEQIASCNH
jgi:hypothetical protein